MSQKYGSMANAAPGAKETKCTVCGDAGPWSWTDLHGEAYCVNCGTPHQLVTDKDDRRGKPNYKPEFVEVVKEFWKATGKRCGGGSFIISRDYETELAERHVFFNWVKENHPKWISTDE